MLAFTMGCDPVRQNDVSIKLWDNDAPAQMYLLNSGSGSLSIEASSSIRVFPNRFHYYSWPVSIAQTAGKASVQLTLFG